MFLPDTLGRKNHADMKLVAIVLCTILLFPWPPLTVLMHRPSPLKVWLITLRSDLEQGTSSRVASAAEPPAMGLITTLLLCTHTASLCTYRQDITRTREPAKTNAYMPCMCVSLTHVHSKYKNRLIKARHQLCPPTAHPHVHWNACRIMLLKCARATSSQRSKGFWLIH